MALDYFVWAIVGDDRNPNAAANVVPVHSVCPCLTVKRMPSPVAD
jgi:hypothetical protein